MEESKINSDFDKWLDGFQGRIASNPDILHHDNYEVILRERLKAAYMAGAASIACADMT